MSAENEKDVGAKRFQRCFFIAQVQNFVRVLHLGFSRSTVETQMQTAIYAF